jgi:hypothetical protein
MMTVAYVIYLRWRDSIMANVQFCEKHDYYWYSNIEYALECPICARLNAAEEISQEAIDKLNEILN